MQEVETVDVKDVEDDLASVEITITEEELDEVSGAGSLPIPRLLNI